MGKFLFSQNARTTEGEKFYIAKRAWSRQEIRAHQNIFNRIKKTQLEGVFPAVDLNFSFASLRRDEKITKAQFRKLCKVNSWCFTSTTFSQRNIENFHVVETFANAWRTRKFVKWFQKTFKDELNHFLIIS